MILKPKGYCFGVVVICSIAVVTFHSGICEPVGYSSRPSEQTLKNDMQSAMLKAKRQHLASRMRLRKSNIHPTFIKSQHLREPSTSAMSALGLAQGQYQNNPSNNFQTNCNKGEVKRITQGRFDIAGADQASTAHLLPSESLRSDTQTEVRGDLQPVVQCTEASMILTVPRRWAAQLHVGTGNYFSFPLSELPPHCGYSIHKSWRDVSIGVQFSGCHVMQEGARYVLPLLWRRTRVKISCPVSPLKSQAVVGLSLCCSSYGVTIRIQGPSAAKELNVNVRGEWTPLLELVQHCGYSMDSRNVETVIAAPFLACGITSRDGNRALSLQIGEEVFALICRVSSTEVPQHQSPQPTASARPKVPMTPNPLQWAPPFYLAPPHFPHPTHHHKTRVHGNAPLTRTTTSFRARQLETPQQDEQRNDHIRPPEEYHRKQASRMDWAKVFPHLKRTASRTRSPTRATGYSPTLLPHNYAFNPYYHFYHHPKIPLTNRPPLPDSVVKSHQRTEVTEKMPMFYRNLASMPHNPFIHHDLRTHFDFRNPMHTTQASPLPTFAAQIQTGHTTETNVRDLAPITPFVNPMPSLTNQHPPYGSPMNPNTPVYTHYRLPHDFYHLYHRPQAENIPTPASVPLLQQIPKSEDPKDGVGSYFEPELPVQFKPGSDPAEGLNDEGESAAHSDPSYDGSSWEKWLEMAAKVNNVPEPLYMLPPLFPLPDEEMREEAGVEDHIRASSMAQPMASPCSPGTGSHFHHTVSPGCFSFPVKECIVGEHFVFSLPEFAVEPKVVGPGDSGVSCALKRLTSNPHVYFVPLHGCGVTKQVIDALMIYQLELETCDSNSLIRMLVECSLYPGFPPAETLLILDPLPLQYLVPLQLRIATDESYSFHPEAHRPLSGLRGRLVFMELSLLQPPDPSVSLRVHYCLAYTLSPYASAMLIYDGCLPGSESQLLPSIFSNIRYIVVTSFLSLTSSNPSIVNNADPEVYFFCLTEVCSSSDGVCSTGCMDRSE